MGKIEAIIKSNLEILAKVSKQEGSKLYVVGGSIRDHLLGKECSDFDFTAKNVQFLANRFASETQSPCIPLDATPGRETLRVVVQKQFHFDFTDMQGKSIEEDLAQRDFSINAMAMRLNDFLDGKETLIDPNQGREDLQNKIIRVLPGPIFSADPLRMLRAFRFASSLEFDISAETIRQIENEKSNLKKTAQERIYYEWILFLSGERVFKLLSLMDRTGLLQCAFPETSELRQSSGTPASVWEISLQTFNRLEDLLSIPKTIIPSTNHAGFLTGRKKALLKFAALLHKLHPAFSGGISNSKVKIDEQAKIVRLLKRVKASNADIRFIFRTILCQQEARESGLEFAGATIKMNDSAASGRDIQQGSSFKSRSQRDAGPEWQQLSLLSKVLRGSRAKRVCPTSPPRVAGRGIKPTGGNESALYRFTKKYDQELMPGIFLACAVQSASENNMETESFLQTARRVVDFYFQRYLPAMDHKGLIDGDDLIRHFKLTPSPLFRMILDKVEEGRVLGTIKSKSQATATAQQIIEIHKTEKET